MKFLAANALGAAGDGTAGLPDRPTKILALMPWPLPCRPATLPDQNPAVRDDRYSEFLCSPAES